MLNGVRENKKQPQGTETKSSLQMCASQKAKSEMQLWTPFSQLLLHE